MTKQYTRNEKHAAIMIYAAKLERIKWEDFFHPAHTDEDGYKWRAFDTFYQTEREVFNAAYKEIEVRPTKTTYENWINKSGYIKAIEAHLRRDPIGWHSHESSLRLFGKQSEYEMFTAKSELIAEGKRKDLEQRFAAMSGVLSEDAGERVQRYRSMLEMTYEQAIAFLLDRHGAATEPYFKEKSFNRFLAGEIKNPTKNAKVARTREGLYCHHIDENRFANIAVPEWIKANDVPYSTQTADRLCYASMIEHVILHHIIYAEAAEDQKHLGCGGVKIMTPIVYDWYVLGFEPRPDWMNNCFWRSYVPYGMIKPLLDQLFAMHDKTQLEMAARRDAEREARRIAEEQRLAKMTPEEIEAEEAARELAWKNWFIKGRRDRHLSRMNKVMNKGKAEKRKAIAKEAKKEAARVKRLEKARAEGLA